VAKRFGWRPRYDP